MVDPLPRTRTWFRAFLFPYEIDELKGPSLVTISLDRRTVLAAAALSPLALPALGGRVSAQDDARALLELAAATMSALTSFHFEIETIEGRSTVLDNLEVTNVVGDVLRPDSFRATITASVAVIDVDVQVISIGGSVWVTNPLDGGWQQIADGTAAGSGTDAFTTLINPDQLFLKALSLIKDPVIDGTERIGDIDTTVVTGTFDPNRLSELATPESGSPEVETGDTEDPFGPESVLSTEPVYLTAWIASDGLVPLIEEAGPITTSESSDVVRALRFTAFDEPVEIVPPEVG